MITKVIPRTFQTKHECPSCGTVMCIRQDKKKKIVPERCNCGRRSGFRLLGEEMIDIQELNLEENPDDLEGRPQQQIRVYLEGDLTSEDFSNLQPGKKIEIVGIIKKLPTFMTQKDEDLNLSEFMIEANNIISLEKEDDITITEKDIEEIREIAALNPLERLSESLVPEVFGNDEIKKAIVLQLVKGVPKPRSDGTFSREDIHILLCGDPGVAKSVTLKAVSTKSPKTMMVVGTKTSKVGLGIMCKKDELRGVWAYECGSLVLSNGGVLCLDEMDKMNPENFSELLEPMSGGTVSLNKAGMNITLPAHTSILAAANPKDGNFDLSRPLAGQIYVPSPILNRFDLIFIMKDKPDKEFDRKAIKHAFDSYTKMRIPLISNEMFKKYIAYCRKLRPELKPELRDGLEDFYINLRSLSQFEGQKGLPINLRNIEGIIRLAEANAKIRLSKFVEKSDLEVAKRIFMFCLKQVGIDNETGLIDTSRITERLPTSKRGKVEQMLRMMHKMSEDYGIMIPYSLVMEEAQKNGIERWEISPILDSLSKSGEIIEPKRGFYQVLS